jgi:hypothetical protein
VVGGHAGGAEPSRLSKIVPWVEVGRLQVERRRRSCPSKGPVGRRRRGKEPLRGLHHDPIEDGRGPPNGEMDVFVDLVNPLVDADHVVGYIRGRVVKVVLNALLGLAEFLELDRPATGGT